MTMRYLVLEYGQINDQLILRDLTDLPNVDLVLWRPPVCGMFKRNLRKLHTSVRLNHYLSLPGRDLWHWDVLRMAKMDDCLIVLAYCLVEAEEDFFQRLREENPKLKVVLLLWDAIHTHSPMMEVSRGKILRYNWDMVLSFDRQDCAEFGFTWLGYHYYSKIIGLGPTGSASDVCFVGADTMGRRELLEGIRHQVLDAGGVADFTLVPHLTLGQRLWAEFFSRSRESYTPAGVRICADTLSYQELLGKSLAANCILELVQPGQMTQTLRYFEAVVYNKKLLSNNPHIMELPFYDARYMRVFEKPDDIDVAWVRKKEPVVYGYAGEFSPRYILEVIEGYFNKRGRIG